MPWETDMENDEFSYCIGPFGSKTGNRPQDLEIACHSPIPSADDSSFSPEQMLQLLDIRHIFQTNGG